MNADRMVGRLTKRVALLATHPRSGRIMEKYQREELHVILTDRVDIVTVRDPRRVLPRRLRDL